MRSMISILLCCICLCCIKKTVNCTVDVNLSELEYLSNHLTDEECYKLYRYLHLTSYEISTSRHHVLYETGHKNCLEYLLRWNSSPGEGKGETHSVLGHRLRQVGRTDLADWLSGTVFENLSEELNRTVISDPFKDLGILTEEPVTEESTPDLVFYFGEPGWDMFDTITMVVAVVCIVIIILLIYALCFPNRKVKEKKSVATMIYQNKRYSLIHESNEESVEENLNIVTG